MDFLGELPSDAVMPGAINCARCAVQAMVEANAIGARQVAAIGEAHVTFLAADGSFAALETCALASIEPARADALTDALLLMFTALVDGGSVALHGGYRSGLGKANGRGKCEKSDAKQRNFHGESP